VEPEEEKWPDSRGRLRGKGAIMTDTSRFRRIVAWMDGTDEAAYAADWAARHAAARGLPLHVLCIPRLAAPVSAGPAHGYADTGYAGDPPGPPDVIRAAEDVRRLRERHPDLPVSERVAQHSCHRPEPELLHHGDILVTSPSGYLELVGQAELEEHAAARVPAPTVFVPEFAVPAEGWRRVLLLTGPRYCPAAAFFAFAAAADLGTTLDVVHLPAAYDEDYGYRPEVGPYAVGPHVRAEVAKLRGRFLGVTGEFRALGARHSWSALHAMTSTAHLAVTGVGAGCGVDVRALYDLDTCPVAVVPEL
jgi:hypothetical protein